MKIQNSFVAALGSCFHGTMLTFPRYLQFASLLFFLILIVRKSRKDNFLTFSVPDRTLDLLIRIKKMHSLTLSALDPPDALKIDCEKTTAVAFLGNSLQYYNDQPRFISQLSQGKLQQNSCYQPLSNFNSLWLHGNKMWEKWNTTNALLPDGTYDYGAPTVAALLGSQPWDFVVMNDYSQAPADLHNRTIHIEVLKNHYAPLLVQCGATPVFMITWAYREEGIHESEERGNTLEFTRSIQAGYQSYARTLSEMLPAHQQPRLAPVGLAFYWIHENNYDMWLKLYHWDSIHPSPHGSFLEGCIIYCAIFGAVPPKEVAIPIEGGPASLWVNARARVMQPEGEPPLPRPTPAEAEFLWKVAASHCTSNYIYDY